MADIEIIRTERRRRYSEAETGTTRKPGREVYSRRAKALVQDGATATDNVLQPMGQTLEIVPERNPHARGTETRMPVRWCFRGVHLRAGW